jgi:hypothetical protein
MKQLPDQKGKKKPYQSPKLLVYGDLAQMTQSRGKASNPDGKTTGTKRRTG